MSQETPDPPPAWAWNAAPNHNQGLRLQVKHRTRFEYHDHAFDSFNDARLCPITDPLQRLEFFSLKVLPDVPVNTYHDFYHNRVDHFEISYPHPELDVQSVAIVQTMPEPRGEPPVGLSLDSLYELDTEENFFDFLTDSHFVSLEAEVWREAIDALPHGVKDLWLDSLTIASHIYKLCEYVPRSTNANTRMIDALRAKRGVCQDFAHIMLAMCRSQGIPARYVSGYFYNENRALDENEASHAWVEIFLPGYGWKGIDPTHDRLADERYLKLAVGRDYADIRPVSGSFRGKGTKLLQVDVKITLAE